MKKQDSKRILARQLAKQLTTEQLKAISAGVLTSTCGGYDDDFTP